MNKITPEHLSRGAIVYIRQSTPGQVANNRAKPVEMATRPSVVVSDSVGALGGDMAAGMPTSRTPKTKR